MKLKRNLTLLDVFSLATGAMISSGIFVLPGLAHAQAGPAVVLSYLLSGLVATAGMLSQAELVSAMPKAGGMYFYVTRTMGPAVGTVDGLLTWFSLSLKSAFALIGMATFARLVVEVDTTIIGVVFCILFVVLNIVGVKEASRLQNGLVGALLLLLLFYIIRGLPEVVVDNFVPFAPYGLTGILSTAGMVFVSYGGLLKVASMAEEVKNPHRVVPLGMILSLLLVSLLYGLIVFVTSGVLGAAELDNSLTPISDAAAVFMGKTGKITLSLAAVLAFVSTANAGLMAASRYPLALSRDRLVPDFFGRINSRFNTPHVAIIITGLFMIAALFLDLTVLVKAASSVLIMTFIFACLSVIILRESRVQNYRPRFRAPLYPWLQIAGIFCLLGLLVGMGRETLLTSAALVAGGLFTYWFYGRIRTAREYALLHLVERITDKAMVDGHLESELKEIIHERDNIVKDRFDHLIEECAVLDMDKPMSMEAFFKLAADELSSFSLKQCILPDNLYQRLIDRERESHTVITEGLAIPHVIIDGEQAFGMLLARCRGGIVFSEDEAPVQVVFVMVGTRDERNFHLRVLSAIAQTVQDPRFMDRWMSAKNEQGLRDIILLSERRRH